VNEARESLCEIDYEISPNIRRATKLPEQEGEVELGFSCLKTCALCRKSYNAGSIGEIKAREKYARALALKKLLDVLARACFGEYGAFACLLKKEPLRRRVVFRPREKQFRACRNIAEMFNARARKPVAAHKAMLRRSRPACFNRQLAHAFAQSENGADHRRRADAEAMRFFSFNCKNASGVRGFVRKPLKNRDKPFDASRAQGIVCRAKLQKIHNLAAPVLFCAPLRFA